MQDRQAEKPSQNVRFPVYEFLILFLPVAVLILVVGFSFASLRTNAQIEAVKDADNTRLQHVRAFVGAEVSSAFGHLRSIVTESAPLSALDRQDDSSLRAMENAFLTLASRNPNYEQVRWIDKTGRERVRISRNPAGPYVVPRSDLQDKSKRYYVQTANAMLPGELYISRVDLNMEWGQIEDPPKPVLRIAAPALNSERRSQGIVVININVKYLLDVVNSLQQETADAQYLLVNDAGEILSGLANPLSSPRHAPENVDFATTHPKLWSQVQAARTGSIEAEGGLWTWSRLEPANILSSVRQMLPQQAGQVDHLVSDRFELLLLAKRPLEFLMALRRDSRVLVSLGTLLGISIYGLTMFLYLSSHMRQRQAQQQAGYALARAEATERLRKLEERYHRMFEVSSVGQLVVDSDGRIEIANAAAEQLLGYDSGELNGISVDTLVPEVRRPSHAAQRGSYIENPVARRMGEGRDLAALTKDGRHVPVEIGLNPYDDGRGPRVLVSLVDLSRRKSGSI